MTKKEIKSKLSSRAITMLQIIRDDNSDLIIDTNTGETYNGNFNVRCDILPQLIKAMAVTCSHRDNSIEYYKINYIGKQMLEILGK